MPSSNLRIQELKKLAEKQTRKRLGRKSIHRDPVWDKSLRALYASARFHEAMARVLVPVAERRRARSEPSLGLETFLHILIWTQQFENIMAAVIRHDEGPHFFAGIIATHLYEMSDQRLGKLTNDFRKSAEFQAFTEDQHRAFDAAKKAHSNFKKQYGPILKEARVNTFAHRDEDIVALWQQLQQSPWKLIFNAGWEYYKILTALIGAVLPSVDLRERT